MLKNARNRCQATPIVGCSEMVISQAIEMRILTAATTTIAAFSAPTDRPVNAVADKTVSGKCKALAVASPVAWPRAYSRPRSVRMHRTTPRMVSST